MLNNFYLRFVINLISDLFPKQKFLRRKIKNTKKHPFKILIIRCYSFLRILSKLRNFSQTYDLLEDEYSKNILNSGNYKLKLFNLKSIGFPIKLYNVNEGIVFSFLLEQYRFNHNNIIDVDKGDIVIDAGSCWGDTALYFATKTGKSGKVISFEFLERNLKVFNENLNLNPNLKDIIEIIKHPIWRDSNREIMYYENGVSGVVFFNGKKNSSQKLSTISIDDFVKEKNLAKIDFIKMDIEGAEIATLLGAKETLTKYQPKLAISIYHDIEHYYKIPYYINSLNLNYSFYLDHFSINRAETILFGIVPIEKKGSY